MTTKEIKNANKITETGLTVTVKRISTKKTYRVSNIVDATFIGKGRCHNGDRFSGCILKNNKITGRVFNMNRNDFEILEILKEENLPLFIKD